MAQYVGRFGNNYITVEQPLGKGGEGSVYPIVGDSRKVLKVFLEKNRTETRHRKLLAMLDTPLTDTAMEQITWPIDIVYYNGKFVGYVMPKVDNIEDLNVIYTDLKYTCTLSEKITIAKNMCAAINSVHEAGQVCGDLNPKNIGVNPQSARVTLVDTDSYHITEKDGSHIYRCEVGLPEYYPPELQEKLKKGYKPANAPLPTFTKYTDLFALAVHIFALLMNGAHPFQSALDESINILSVGRPSVANPQPIENICSGFFLFYKKQEGLSIPVSAPPFEILPQNIQNLFVKAFVDGHKDPTMRPDCAEWFNALTEMQKNLKTCSYNSKHQYPSHVNCCPWCELETKVNTQVNKFILGSIRQIESTQQTTTTLNKNPSISQTNISLSKSSAISKTTANQTITQKKPKKKKQIRFDVLGKVAAGFVIVMLIGYFVYYGNVVRPKNQLQSATSYASEGNYEKAIKILSKMGDYENAPELLLKYKFLDNSTYVTIGNGTTWSTYNGRESDNAHDLQWKKVKVEGTKYFLVSRYYIGDEVFDYYKEDATWAECSLREWLDDYYINHFTDVEKSIILTTNNYTPDYHDAETGSHTEDKLFLLSEAEYSEIGSIDMDSEHNSFWWLRINYSYDHPNYIARRGKIEVDEKMACSGNTYVRAAMWVDIELLG